MGEIKYLFDGINRTTIPDIIYDELSRHGDERSFTSYTNEKGERITEYGKLMPPYNCYFNYGSFGFWCLEKYFKLFEYYLEKGQYFDEKNKQLNKKIILPYLKDYAKGFEDGYYKFEDAIKPNSNIFTTTNEQIAHKVFSRVYGLLSVDNGSIKYGIIANLEVRKKMNNPEAELSGYRATQNLNSTDFYETSCNYFLFHLGFEYISKLPFH